MWRTEAAEFSAGTSTGPLFLGRGGISVDVQDATPPYCYRCGIGSIMGSGDCSWRCEGLSASRLESAMPSLRVLKVRATFSLRLKKTRRLLCMRHACITCSGAYEPIQTHHQDERLLCACNANPAARVLKDAMLSTRDRPAIRRFLTGPGLCKAARAKSGSSLSPNMVHSPSGRCQSAVERSLGASTARPGQLVTRKGARTGVLLRAWRPRRRCNAVNHAALSGRGRRQRAAAAVRGRDSRVFLPPQGGELGRYFADGDAREVYAARGHVTHSCALVVLAMKLRRTRGLQ